MQELFLTDLFELLRPVIDDRVEQIQLEVERNPGLYPEHNLHFNEYRQHREAFEQRHRELAEELDTLITDVDIRYADIGCEIYRQGAHDCAALLLKLFCQEGTTKGEGKE